MKNSVKLPVLLVLISFCINIPQTDSLIKSELQNNLGTRTPYRLRSNLDDSPIKFPKCVDSKIWMLMRHGTRFPKALDIRKMNTTLHNLKYEVLLRQKFGLLNTMQIQEIEDWWSEIKEEDEKKLTHEGEVEMLRLAERMKKRFPNVIKKKYDDKHFLFRYTATQRAQRSAIFFTIGLLNKRGSQDVRYAPATKVDPILRFYKHCDRWQKQVKRNESTYMEKLLFGKSLEMNKTLARISERLGLGYQLPIDIADIVYKVCGYETAWHEFCPSPWCAAFDEESAKTMEYYEALKHYWQDSYGHNLTYRQACVSINDMFHNFVNNTGASATFLFAHSGTLLKILTHLQLYKPKEHLRWDTKPEGRTWKTSEIDCFGSNLAFVLYKCKDQDYVLTLHQEKPIKLPMCEQELCPLNTLLEAFHSSIYLCDYTDMCRLK